MNRRVFDNHLSDFKAEFSQMAIVFFSTRNMKFDAARFEQYAMADTDQIGRDAMFYGAAVYPDEETELFAVA